MNRGENYSVVKHNLKSAPLSNEIVSPRDCVVSSDNSKKRRLRIVSPTRRGIDSNLGLYDGFLVLLLVIGVPIAIYLLIVVPSALPAGLGLYRQKPPKYLTSPLDPKNTPSRRLCPMGFVKDWYVGGFEQPSPELCPARGKHLRLLIVVPSEPRNVLMRNNVRLTWGRYVRRPDVALIFLLGALPDEQRPALEQENALYRDFVIGRHVDTYWNLTLKSLAMLEWVRDYCPLARHILKADDDQFINVPRLLRFLEKPERVNAIDTLWGSKKGCYPLELKDMFKNKRFLTGPAYIFTRDIPARMLSLAMKERYIRWEDVFVTGVMAAHRMGSQIVHTPEIFREYFVAARPWCYITVKAMKRSEMFDLWRRHFQSDDGCQITEMPSECYRSLTVSRDNGPPPHNVR